MLLSIQVVKSKIDVKKQLKHKLDPFILFAVHPSVATLNHPDDI